jgi:hypothetical protein
MSDSDRPSGNSHPPKYSRQRRKRRPDRAFVRIDGKKVYLGEYGADESRIAYGKVISQLGISAPPDPSDNPSVAEMILAHLEYASVYYGNP